MKRKQAQVEKPSSGTVRGAKARAECNGLSVAARKKLREEFLKLYYGGETKPGTIYAPSHL